MAKKAEQPPSLLFDNRWILFFTGTALLSAAYWMEQWPLLAFIALIPGFALASHSSAHEKILELTELLLFVFGIALVVGYRFDLSKIFPIVGLALVFTLPFVLFVFSRVGGGPLTSNFLIVIYWLAVEYVLLKIISALQINPGTYPVFISDLLINRPEWFRWDAKTGYLAVSFWILLTNWIGYQLISKPFRWMLLVILILIVAGPLAFGYWSTAVGITRNDMITLYTSNETAISSYALHGEWIGRTCAWVSVLVLLFSSIRFKTKKK